MTLAPTDSTISEMIGAMWLESLSITKMSNGLRFGTTHSQIYCMNKFPFRVPAKAKGLVSPETRIVEITDMRLYLTSGIYSTILSPLGARPYRRVMPIFTDISSRYTNLFTSIYGIYPSHSPRSHCTSGRSCFSQNNVFFESQICFGQLAGEG